VDYKNIIYDVDETVAIITLNRPDRLNAWTDRMGAEYRDALQRADGDSGVRAVILTGAGRGFCAGADMAALNNIAGEADDGGEPTRPAERPPAGENGGLESNYQQVYSWPLRTRKPLIAAVNGPVAGLGLVISLYCDMRFASDQARFGTAFVKLGLIAEHGISWLLPRLVGTANALDLLYSGRLVNADEALNMGLVNRVVPHDRLLDETKEYCRMLATNSSPRAMSIIKQLVWDAQFQDLATSVGAANAEMAKCFSTPDFREGLAAFAEKRSPSFQGLGEG
jgi:enoyl-CoA hydratase/carnithine racemase